MSSTSKEIDDSKVMAAKVEAGEQVNVGVNTGGAAAEQLTTSTPQQPAAEIPKGTTTGGLNRENMQIVQEREAISVIHDREIAPVVGKGQEHNLKKLFLNPTEQAEEQTAIPNAQMSSSEKRTQVPELQKEAADRIARVNAGIISTRDVDEVTAAKQTKVPEKQKNSAVAKAQKFGNEYSGDSGDTGDSSDFVDSGDTGETTVDSGDTGDTGDTGETTVDSGDTGETTVDSGDTTGDAGNDASNVETHVEETTVIEGDSGGNGETS